ncbi:MAG: C/D box methylation guide ribonucleoprotein complex aNOP56 subunit [Chloroflexota bacterium]
MKAFIVQFPFGILAFGEDNQLVEETVYPKKAQAAAKAIIKAESGKLDHIKELIDKLQTVGYDTFVFDNEKTAAEIRIQLGVTTEVSDLTKLRSRMEEYAISTGFVKDDAELNSWNRSITMEIAKLRVRGAVEQRDLIVAQAIQTLDDLDRTVNLFMGRLREWYGVHFPELDRLVEKHETYARLVMDLGERENFTVEALQKEDIPQGKTEAIIQMAETSMGADISANDLTQIQALSRDVLNLYELRKSMENYVDKTMEEVAINIRALVGSLLGARLIAISGSLRNLAMRPASTIQVLGAEKALFRSLKTGARPPKHGLIFQAALLHDAKRWQRGKIARALAGKLSIAARADAFGDSFIGDRLNAELEKRIAEIKEKYKEPPAAKERPLPERREERREFRPQREFRGQRPQGKGRRHHGGKWRRERRANKG